MAKKCLTLEQRVEKERKKIEKTFADYKKKHDIKGDIFKVKEKKKVVVVDKLPSMFTKGQIADFRRAQKRVKGMKKRVC